MDVGQQIVSVVIVSLIGGSVSGIAAMAAIKVQLRWHHSEIRRAHRRMDDHLRHHRKAGPVEDIYGDEGSHDAHG